jgi:hypothetical protein
MIKKEWIKEWLEGDENQYEFVGCEFFDDDGEVTLDGNFNIESLVEYLNKKLSEKKA